MPETKPRPMPIPDHLRDMRITRNLRVRMRDGVELVTNVFLPRSDGPFPVVLVRMSYNRAQISGAGLCERGFAVVVQDTRGRYASEGKFYPFVDETNDGLDTLDWIGAQSWCNGKVGMFGDSYLAGVQLALAHTDHPLLAAFNPRFMSGDVWRQAYYCDGVFSLALVFSWLCMECGSSVSEASLLPLFDVKGLLKQLPIVSLDEKSGSLSPYYRDYVTHGTRDEYWQRMDYRQNIERCKVPMLLTGGWYDYYPNETFRNFEALMRAPADDAVKAQHRVLIGPWTHGMNWGTKMGELDFGEGSRSELDHSFRWLEAILRGGGADAYGKGRIRIFVMGANQWRDENEWPLARTRWTKYYLHSKGRANTFEGNGRLSPQAPSSDEPADHYTYDPTNPVATLGGNHSVGGYNPGLYEMCMPGPFDQRPTEQREDVPVYTSDVLSEDVELTGPIVLKLHASTSALDTDFAARLTDVYPDGRSINITEGVIRARYWRRVWDKPELLEPGRVYELTIELQPTSNVFKKGHRMRLQITSSNFPLWDRNLNTGGDQAYETNMIVAEQSVLHDKAHASHLVLPVVPA